LIVAVTPLSIFDRWWQTIEAAAKANTLNPLQAVYKEIYVNILRDDRWLSYLRGLGITLEVSLMAVLLGIVLGTTLAILRMSSSGDVSLHGKTPLRLLAVFWSRVLSRISRWYISLFRGTPLLLQVLIINYAVFGTSRISKVLIGGIACGLNSAAYVSEIVRGGILSVEKGQTEAGRSLGLSNAKTMFLIVLPQAAKSALPSMCNEFISLIKETSVLSYIALTELTKAGDYIRSRTYSAFTPYLVSGALYLSVVLVLTWLIGKLERRLRKGDNR
jgi:arginine/lysine/histidine transport system permease protein